MRMKNKFQKIKPLKLGLYLFIAGVCIETSILKGSELSPQSGRKVLNFNRNWKFARGEMDGAERSDFDDSAWKQVRLPHDWAIAGPFNPKENGYAGKLPWKGVGWYRKTFTLNNRDSDKRIYIDFDGVMAFPKVYINGKLAGQWDYGYMSFRVDATKYVNFDDTNVIAVYVDTRQHGTRWYPGAGIYRKVTMTVCEQIHVAHWGTFVTTPEISDSSATVRVKVNCSKSPFSTRRMPMPRSLSTSWSSATKSPKESRLVIRFS